MKSKKAVLDSFVGGLIGAVKSTKDFVVEQAPDIVKQLIAERMVELKFDAVTYLIAGIASLSIAVASMVVMAMNWHASDPSAAFFIGFAFGFVSLIVTIMHIALLIETAKELAMLKVAPKVYVLNRLRDFL